MTSIGSCLRLLKRKQETAHTHMLLHHRMGLGSPRGKGCLNITVETDLPFPPRASLSVWPLHLCLLLQIIFSLKSCLYLLGSSKHFYPSTLILPNRTLTLVARLFMNTNKQNLGMHGGHYSREFIRILTQTQRIKTLTGHCCQKLNGLELMCRPLMLSST